MDQEDDIFAQVTVELEIDFYEGVAKNLIWAGVVFLPPPLQKQEKLIETVGVILSMVQKKTKIRLIFTPAS